MPNCERMLKTNKMSREKLQELRDKCAQALFSTDDALVTIKDYLCVMLLDIQLLKADNESLSKEIDKLNERMLLKF